MKLPVYLDILWHINYWLELIVPVIFLLFYKQLPKTKFVKAFVIYLLFNGINRPIYEYVSSTYETVFPATHLIMPIEAFLVFYMLSTIWQELERFQVHAILLILAVFIGQELYMQNIFENNWIFSVFQYASFCLLFYAALIKEGARLSRVSFLFCSVFLIFSMVMLIFVVFEDKIRYAYFLSIVVFSILYILFISMYLTFIYLLYLLSKKADVYE
ncbi:MAG: hypothetical protein RIS89_231 [Bacteroidota bacterium]|jgi:hypothetical protein